MKLFAIGSPQTGDDIAWRTIEIIEQELAKVCPGLQVYYLDRPGIQLVNELRDETRVIIIDALLTDAPIGDIQQIQPDELLCDRHSLSSHDFSVANALLLAEQLGVYPEHLWLYGISSHTSTPFDQTQIMDCAQRLQQILMKII